MRALIILALSLFLTACGALQTAGIAEYSFRPMVLEKQTVCCEVVIKNGKEYASLKATVRKTGNDYSVELEEQSVRAFAGQKQTADVVTGAVKSAATVGAALVGGTAVGAGVQAVLP